MTWEPCLRGLRHYLRWWWASLRPGRHPGAPLGLRRLVFLGLLFPLFLLLQCVHWVAWILDGWCFPQTRRVSVEAPVFITGIPRSGTTFVHRSLAATWGLVTFPTWEALLAPSYCEKRLLRALAALDRRLGRPLRQTADWLLHRMSGDFNDIHPVDLSAPEEDYLALLPFGGCFLMALAFPFVAELRDLARFDRLPARRRRELLALYHQCLQKTLYGHPPGTRLLSKNAAFASWLPALAAAYPDAKFLLCVREPLAGLSSQLSSLAGARAAFGTDPAGRATASLMMTVFQHNLAQLAALRENPALTERCRVLAQADLQAAPAPVLSAAADFAGLGDCPRLQARIGALRPRGGSAHPHDPADIPADTRRFQAETAADYQAILDLPCRIRTN